MVSGQGTNKSALFDSNDGFDVEFDIDDNPFDRPTVIPSAPAGFEDDFASKEAEDTLVILKRSEAPARSDLPEFDFFEESQTIESSHERPRAGAPDPARESGVQSPPTAGAGSRSKLKSLDDIDMWGGGSGVPSEPPPMRPQMPTVRHEEPVGFDLDLPSEPPGKAAEVSKSYQDLSFDIDIPNPEEQELQLIPVEDDEPLPPPSEARPITEPYPIDDLWGEGPGEFGSPHKAPQFRPSVPSDPAPKTAPLPLEPQRHDDTSFDPFARPARSEPIVPGTVVPGSRGSGRPSEPRSPRQEMKAAPAVAPSGSDDALTDMRDRYALGDFSGALIVAECILETDPRNSEASRYADNCRERLLAMYSARLGSVNKVPRVILPPDQVRWLSLDHKAGFILSCVDGFSTIEEILDVSGMAPLEALRILYDLQQQRVIAVS